MKLNKLKLLYSSEYRMKALVYLVVPIVFLTAILGIAMGCTLNVLKEFDEPMACSSYKMPNPTEMDYYSTIEEAVYHSDFYDEEYSYNVSHIVKIIKLFQNDRLASVFVQSDDKDSDIIFVYMCYTRIESDGRILYSKPIKGTGIMWYAHKQAIVSRDYNATDEVKFCLSLYSARQHFSIDNTKNFFWGLSQTEKVKNLKIEGQPVTEVIELELDGEPAYFWYFEDLATDKELFFQVLNRYIEEDFIITMD